MVMPPHPKYTQLSSKKKEDSNRGGSFGYLGRGENYYSDTELKSLGEGLVEWIKKEGNIWCKYYFVLLEYPISWDMVIKLRKRSPEFNSYIETALLIQESKLVTEPYDNRKKKDGTHARWVLARYHRGDWEDKPVVIAPEDNEKLDKATALIDYLQSKSDLNIAASNINKADRSRLDTGEESA